jgi:hypothetical protein
VYSITLSWQGREIGLVDQFPVLRQLIESFELTKDKSTSLELNQLKRQPLMRGL